MLSCWHQAAPGGNQFPSPSLGEYAEPSGDASGSPPEHRTKTRNANHGPPPEDRPWRRAPQSAPPRRSVADLDPRTPGEIEAGQALLEATRAHCTEEQRRHTANRVSQLFTEGLARTRALKDAKLKGNADAFQSSSSRPVRWTAATGRGNGRSFMP